MKTNSNGSWRFVLGREDAYRIFQTFAYHGVSYRVLRSFRRALLDGGTVRDMERLRLHASEAGVCLPRPADTRHGGQPINSDSRHWLGRGRG